MNHTHRWLAWLNWSIVTSFVLFQFFIQSSSGVMAAAWAHDYQLTRLGVSNLSAAFFYPYLLLQIPAGLLFDRFGPRVVLSGASLLLAVGSWCFAIAHDYSIAIAARAVMGAGAGFGFVGMLLVIADWFEQKHFALLVGVSESLTMVLLAVGINALVWVVASWGWRWSMQVAAIVALVMLVLSVLFIRRHHRHMVPAARLPIMIQLKMSVMNRYVWLAGIYGFCLFAILNAFTSLWGFPFLKAVHHLSSHQAGAVLAMCFIGIGVGAPINGLVTMRLGRQKPVLIACAFIAGIIMLSLCFVPKLTELSLSVLLFLLGFFSASYVQTFALVSALTEAPYRGAAMSLTNMVMMLSAPALQLLIGWLLSHHVGYAWSVATIGFGFILAGCVACMVPEIH